MADTLVYRIPGKKTIVLNGNFKEVESLSSAVGFVVTSFNKDKKYIFEAGKEDGALYVESVDARCQSHDEYIESATEFLDEIKGQNLHKAVFSRVKEVPFRKNAQQLFYCLCEEYPDAFVYLISSPLFGTWIGATPEYLLSVEAGVAKTLALAGTLRSKDDRGWEQKEIDEQEYVCDFIREKLKILNVDDVSESDRSEMQAGPVRHLASTFTFSIRNTSASDLMQVLHPTPAVSGHPQKESIALIKEIEEHERALYSGVIGVMGEEETRLFVNLRCAQLTDDKAYLYLGGGFTADSDVEKEWTETENKARTLLDVLENL